MDKVRAQAIHKQDLYIVSLMTPQILAPLYWRRGAEQLLTFIMTHRSNTHTYLMNGLSLASP